MSEDDARTCLFLHRLNGEVYAHPLHSGFPPPDALIQDGVKYERKEEVDYFEVEEE